MRRARTVPRPRRGAVGRADVAGRGGRVRRAGAGAAAAARPARPSRSRRVAAVGRRRDHAAGPCGRHVGSSRRSASCRFSGRSSPCRRGEACSGRALGRPRGRLDAAPRRLPRQRRGRRSAASSSPRVRMGSSRSSRTGTSAGRSRARTVRFPRWGGGRTDTRIAYLERLDAADRRRRRHRRPRGRAGGARRARVAGGGRRRCARARVRGPARARPRIGTRDGTHALPDGARPGACAPRLVGRRQPAPRARPEAAAAVRRARPAGLGDPRPLRRCRLPPTVAPRRGDPEAARAVGGSRCWGSGGRSSPRPGDSGRSSRPRTGAGCSSPGRTPTNGCSSGFRGAPRVRPVGDISGAGSAAARPSKAGAEGPLAD